LGGDPRLERSIGNAMKGAERAASLTQRLLAFSRRQPLAPKPLNVDRLVGSMSDLLKRSLGETIRLEVVTAPGLWSVEADPNQLESAILNLAVNARDAMPRGGTLTIETANAWLDESYAASQAEVAPGNYVVIAVSDTGEGMSKETLARVFEPFFTTKEVGKGTGLGLSMIYGFVKQTGGHVKVYSEEGRGTTVKIYLPRLAGTHDEEEARKEDEVLPGHANETVLVVEDDDDVRAYSVDLLRELGYRVLEAHDGAAALRLLERPDVTVDLMFTDVVMPNMSGRELVDAARKLRPRLKVLYTSGYTRNAIVHGGRLDAGVEMIAKPFTYHELSVRIRDLLDAVASGRLLVVDPDASMRLRTGEMLANRSFAVDEAANAVEAMGKIRAAAGRYSAVLLGPALTSRAMGTLIAEIRGLHLDLPLLLLRTSAGACEDIADDPCMALIEAPFTAEHLMGALKNLGIRCARRSDRPHE
jgi:CheY-like chemotaxis protein